MTLCRTRKSLLKSAEQKTTALFSTTDACDPTRTVTVSLLARPASVPLATLSSLLACAPPVAHTCSATIPRRAQTPSLKSTERFSALDARDPPRKVMASRHAQPANMPLAALCSLSAFAPPTAYAFSATTPRYAHATSPGPWKCPAITQLKSTDTSGLELSQLGPDTSPPDLPRSNVLSSGINPKRLLKVITPTDMIGMLGQCNGLKSKGKLPSLDMTAPAPSSEEHYAVPPDFSFRFLEKNGCCLEGNNKNMSILEIDSRIRILEENPAVNESSTPVLRSTIPATPLIPNLRGRRPKITDNEFCFSGK